MKVKRDMPLAEALEEITTVVQQLKGSGPAKVNGHELGMDDKVTLEIETESTKKGGELEFEIKWPPAKSKGKNTVELSEGKKRSGKRRWFIWALVGAAATAGAIAVARRRQSSGDEYDDEFSTTPTV
jgi:hypothetical protein